jgi:hypothetical protein
MRKMLALLVVGSMTMEISERERRPRRGGRR